MFSQFLKPSVFIYGICMLYICTDCFEVIPQYEEVITTEDDVATFNYVIKPWPPPYKLVDISFISEVTGTQVELCKVTYNEGTYDENTGNCTLWDPRMYPYDPATPNGVYFSFEPVEWEDHGQYVMLIEYSNRPDINTTVQLTVHVNPSAPNITEYPDKYSYQEGEEVALRCVIRHVNPPADLEWTRGMFDVMDPDPNDYIKGQDYYDFTNSTIRFRVQQSDHGMAYVCSAYVDVNTQQYTASVALNVEYKPVLELSPCTDTAATYFVTEGHNAYFTCDISANPHYGDINWYRKTENDPDFVKISKPNRNVTQISLSKVQRNDSSTFKCDTSNTIGPGEGQCVMEVQYGPEVDVPSELEVSENEPVDIDCKAVSNPAPHYYKWMDEKGNLIQEGPRFNISNVKPEDSGKYICEVWNTLTPTGKLEQIHTGRDTMELRVLFAPRLQEFALTKFAGHSGQSAVIVCDVNAYPEVTFSWKLNGQTINTDSYRNVSNDGYRGFVHVYKVGEPDYGQYECSVQNDVGPEQIQLELLQPGVPDAPQHCTVHNITDYYTNLQCIPGYDGGENLMTFVQAHAMHGKTKDVSSSVTWSPDYSHMIVTVTDLEPKTEYNLHVYGENKHGRSQGHLTVHVMTVDGPGNPNPPPRDDGSTLGLVMGATLGLLALVALLVLVAMIVLWRVGLEPACARQAQEQAGVQYTTLLKKDGGRNGYQNKAYESDMNTAGRNTVPNEYAMIPGVTRQSVPLQDMSKSSRQDNKTNEAYELRKQQSALAGMGALTYNSTQHIPTAAAQQSQYSGKGKSARRPPRPDTIGGPSTDHWEYTRDNLDIRQKLGEGAFGEVWKCVAKSIKSDRGTFLVAVKFLRENRPLEEQEAFQKELRIMKSLGPHPNVIALLGCCTTSEPLYIILEYAEHGNLQSYLRDHRNDVDYNSITEHIDMDTRTLTIFALHVASGMEYISGLGYLHRDLAARNVLLDGNLTCKICDFGLARDVINCRMYESKTQRRLPIRWMAPESLFDSVYTRQSDVWSFGVLLWEILTLGSTPYPGLSGPEIMELIRSGYRMDKPRHCSKEMYNMMRSCWQDSATDRPVFTALRENLETLIHDLDTDPHRDGLSVHDNQFRILTNAPGEKC